MAARKVALLILDGWGIAKNPEVSAIDKAQTPFMDGLKSGAPQTQLEASGLAVGLPEGQMGNSEVGHMNLGAGRVVYQDLVKINMAVQEGSLAKEPVLLEAFAKAKENKSALHFMGLLSDGGVHAHINHLKALCSAAEQYGLTQVYVHVFTDGRDTDPRGGLDYVRDLEQHLAPLHARISTLVGRYYGMDRDRRWERTAEAYALLTAGKGKTFASAEAAIEHHYQEGITDEFIRASRIALPDNQGLIQPGDVVFNFNFRTDRGRQIVEALHQSDLPDYGMRALPIEMYTLTRYDETFKNVGVVYEKDNLRETLGEVLAKAGKTQIRIAETEKYPHVTYFFSGGQEEPFEGERRFLCPSPKVATYDLQPEMSAYDITKLILPEIRNTAADFICLNYANPDMVGHTGDMNAAIKACEVVDECTGQLVEAGLRSGYTFIILADHGNSDCMVNPDGTPNTAHTTQPVPCYLLGAGDRKMRTGVLGDVAPTILELMNIEQPAAMSGKSLLL